MKRPEVCKPFKLADAGGLFLLVTPTGGRLWRLKYRVGGKKKRLSIGPYLLFGLRDAREARDTAKRLLLRALDPSQAKRDARREAEIVAGHSLKLIAEEYAAKLRREG